MRKDFFTEIGKYLAGELSEDRISKLHKWIEQSPENRELFNEIRDFWMETQVQDSFNNSESVFEKVLNDINEEETNSISQTYNKENSGFLKGWVAFKAAAVILIITACSLSIWYLNYNDSSNSDQQTNKIELTQKINQSGQKSKIHLSDGSTVFLNADSKLEYYSEFSDTARNVYLSGEAFFEVAKDEKRPFTVHSNNMSVTALGTAFNFSAYHDNDYSQVSLLEGRLKINSGPNWEILEAGEILEHERAEDQFRKRKGDITEFVAWKDGILIFKENDFSEIKQKLERWYGVTIIVSGQPNNDFKFYGRFDNEYLSNVLESMRYGNEFEYSINGKEVNINFK